MGRKVSMAVAVLAALLGWISYGHVALLLASDLLVSYWFTRRRIVAAEGPVTQAGLHYSRTGSFWGRSIDRELHPVQGEPLAIDDRRFVASTHDIFVGAGCVALAVGALAWDTDGLLSSPLQVVVWLTLTAQLAVAEQRAHRSWLRDGAHLTADPTRQGLRDVFAAFGLAFVGLAAGGVFTGGRVAAVVLTVAGLVLDRWRRNDPQNPTRDRDRPPPPRTPLPPTSPERPWRLDDHGPLTSDDPQA